MLHLTTIPKRSVYIRVCVCMRVSMRVCDLPTKKDIKLSELDDTGQLFALTEFKSNVPHTHIHITSHTHEFECEKYLILILFFPFSFSSLLFHSYGQLYFQREQQSTHARTITTPPYGTLLLW